MNKLNEFSVIQNRSELIASGFINKPQANNQDNEIEKAHIKSHQRKTKSGKIVQVKDYDDKRQAKGLNEDEITEIVNKLDYDYFVNNNKASVYRNKLMKEHDKKEDGKDYDKAKYKFYSHKINYHDNLRIFDDQLSNEYEKLNKALKNKNKNNINKIEEKIEERKKAMDKFKNMYKKIFMKMK